MANIIEQSNGVKTISINTPYEGVNASINALTQTVAGKAEQSDLDTTNAQLASNTQRWKNIYVDVKQDYGAKGDDSNDDTQAIQNAINYAYTNKCGVYFPIGTYKVTGTIYLPTVVNLFGNLSSTEYYTITPNTVIKAYISSGFKSVFKPQTVNGSWTPLFMKMKNLAIVSTSPEQDTYVFDGFNLEKAYIKYNLFASFGVVFHSIITAISRIEKNDFVNTCKSVLSTRDINTSSNLTDSWIIDNYINMSINYTNTVGLDLVYPNMSWVKSNFIEFSFNGIACSNNGKQISINENIFDYCYRGFNLKAITNFTLNENKFSNCKQSTALSHWIQANLKESSNYNTMQTTNWAGIGDMNSCSNGLMETNLFYNCDISLNLTGSDSKDLITQNNKFDAAVSTQINLRYYNDANSKSTGLVINELNYTNVTTLPSATIGDGGVSQWVTSFNGQILNYNGKLVYNNNGAWKDFMGNAVS